MKVKRQQLISTEDWVASLPSTQTSVYTYKDSVYTGTDNEIEITCPQHGNFWQRAYLHKRKGAGCPKCATEKSSLKLRSNLKDFIARTLCVPAIAGKYTYFKSVYVNNQTPLLVTCPLHGDFSTTPGNHLAGKGCQTCFDSRRHLNNKKDPLEFKNQLLALATHYDYSKVVYTGAKDKITIICPTHGEFRMTPDNHLNGQGCSGCAKHGFDTSKQGTLYVLSDNSVTKVGITNRTAKHRQVAVAKTGGPSLEVVKSFKFTDGGKARKIELACHKWLAERYQKVLDKFDGSTECFLNVDLAALLNYVTPLATTEAA